jgi:hypothetical protein
MKETTRNHRQSRPCQPGKQRESTAISPSDCSLIPLLIGVTGHRDIREDDVPQLRARVIQIFDEIRERCPNTPLVVLSPLAEGADRIVAHAALDTGLRLIVPLPMAASDYERDFVTEFSRREFQQLLDRAEHVFVVDAPGIPKPETAQDSRYRQVGAFVVQNCHVLVALWDGIDSEFVGGTAEVVQAQRKGTPWRHLTADPLDPPEAGPVYHVVTRRASNAQPDGEPFALRRLGPSQPTSGNSSWESHLRVIDCLETYNRDVLRYQATLANQRRESRDRLLPTKIQADLPAELLTDLEHFATADALAVYLRNRLRWMLWSTLALALLWVIAMQVHSTLPDEPTALSFGAVINLRHVREFLIDVYLGGLIAASAIGVYLAISKTHNRFLDYRALAEGLRVRLFWRMNHVADAVSDHYLRKQRSELDWIRQSFRATSVRRTHAESDRHSLSDPEPLEITLVHWVKDQATYFRNAATRDTYWSQTLAWIGGRFLLPVFLTLAVIKVLPEFLMQLGMAKAADASLHVQWIQFCLTMFLTLATILAVCSKTLAFSEHAKQYSRMAFLFGTAHEKLTALVQTGGFAEAKDLLATLGRESLAENGDWVLIHRDRSVELPRAS